MIAKDRIIKYLLMEGFTHTKDNVYLKYLKRTNKVVVFMFRNCLVLKVICDSEVIRSKEMTFGKETKDLCEKIKELINILTYFGL